MALKTLSIPDISCGHCKASLEGAMNKLRGISNALADVPGKTLSLEYDESQVSLKDIIRVIEETGYTVEG